MATLKSSDIRPQIVDGLAVYDLGHGVGQEEVVLLLPSVEDGADWPDAPRHLAMIFLRLGKRVITFDLPLPSASAQMDGADQPSLTPCTLNALHIGNVTEPVIVAARNNGSFHALMLAHDHPELVKQVVLVGDLATSPGAQILAEISAPVLVYVGEADTAARAHAAYLAGELPDAQVVICAQGGIRPDADAPLHFGAVLQRFLTPADPRPGKVISVEM